MNRLDRYRGALVGLAVGDAVGTTVEFQPRGSIEPLTDMVGGGPFRLKGGQWTDDTSMALCLAESLIARGGFDAHDQMTRYLNWWRWGHRSSTGECFDIGTTVRDALARFERTGDPWAGSDDPQTAGNGSLMRLAPVVLWAHPDLEQAKQLAAASSRTTHAAAEAVEACMLFAELMHRARGVSAAQRGGSPRHGLRRRVARSRAVVLCEGGQIAGAHWGFAGIPQHWRQRLHDCEEICEMADRLGWEAR